MIPAGSIWKKRQSTDAEDADYARVLVTGKFEGEIALRPADPAFGPVLTCTEASFRAAFDLEQPAPEPTVTDELLTRHGEWSGV